MTLIGLAAILWAILTFDRNTPFPRVRALVPSVGTAFVLAFAQVDGLLRRLLTWRVLVTIGLISYSAYLWHQPVFAFVHIAGYHPDLSVNLILVLLCLVLAWLSWRYVELPFRNRAYLPRRAVFGWAAVASIVTLAGGAWLTVTHGVSSRFTAQEMKWWRYADIGLMSRYVTDRFNNDQGVFSNGTYSRILVIGDSFAQDFVNMVAESGSWPAAQIRTVYIPVICQMSAVKQDVSKFIAQSDQPGCARSPNIVSSMPLIQKADVIVLAAHWAKWSAELLPETIRNMRLRSDQRLFVVGSKNFSPVNVRQFLSLGPSGREGVSHRVAPSVSEVNSILRNELPANVFVDQVRIVCGLNEECPLVTGQDGLISYDGDHLTQEGAAYIGKKIFSESSLAQAQ
ncbi:MAG: acyltransferase [Castellaniella sp.]|nr:acyltransferase [Castellaniella sp.]